MYNALVKKVHATKDKYQSYIIITIINDIIIYCRFLSVYIIR